MKTNHRRDYKELDKRSSAKFGQATKKLPAGLGSVVASYGDVAVNGRRGEAKSKLGAKKYLRNQVRKTKEAHIKSSLVENGTDSEDKA